MKAVIQHLRDKIHQDCRVQPCSGVSLQDLQQTEWNPRFVELMQNRLLMGALRYGKMCEPEKAQYDFLSAIMDKVRKYQKTGNDECLVDIANYALLEFTLGSHPLKHFRSEDDVDHAKMK